MVRYNNYNLYDGTNEKGYILYNNLEKKIGFGILEHGDYLLDKNPLFYRINKEEKFFTGFLPFLEINPLEIKSSFEEKGFDFYKEMPVEKIILTAFEESFSLYWKELAVNWIDILNCKSEKVIKLLVFFSSRDSYFPISLKNKIRNILQRRIDEAK